MHIYEVDGKKLPSVTTIIHSLGNDEIVKWANYLGFKHLSYEKELEKSANNGTLMHELLRGEVDKTYTPSVQFKDAFHKATVDKRLIKFRKYMSSYEYDTIFTEKTLISSKLGYGGTLDWYAKFYDKFYMINDFKTSKTVRFSHLLQLGGYYNLLKEHGYTVNGGSIILCNDKVTSLFPINESELQWCADAFQPLADFYNKTWMHEIKPNQDMIESLKSTKA